MKRTETARGALCAVGASAMFALMGACVRYSATELPNEMLVFLRSAFGLLALVPLLLRQGPHFLGTGQLRYHISRSVAGLAAMYCLFFALAHMPLAEAMLLNFSSPLFVGPLAWLFLRERLPLTIAVALGIGFLGVALVLKPGAGMWSGPAAIGLLSGILAAFAMISIRRLAHTEPSLRTVFYFSVFSTLASSAPLYWQWLTPSPLVLLTMAFAGVCAAQGQILLTRAYAAAPAAEIGPFTYSTIVFAALLDWMVWRVSPDSWSILGTGLVCLSGHLVHRQSHNRP